MKKILFVMNVLQVGGASKSLLNLLNFIKDKYDITLLFFRKDGELMSQIPEGIKVIVTDDYMATFVAGLSNSKNLGFKRYSFKFVMGCWNKLFKNNVPFLKYALSKSQKLTGFDYAVSFDKVRNKSDVWSGTANFVINNVEADKKYAFLHDDYLPADYNAYTLEQYKSIDKIYTVSKSVMNKVINNVPQLADKMDYIYNFCNGEEFEEKAKEENVILSDKLNIVSVARLSKEKGFDRVLNAINKLKNDGYKFVYHIVGDGLEKEFIETYIQENNLQDYVKMWGYKSNPYPYIKAADLMLCGSYRESFGISLVEAMLLGTPVITTETTSAKEIVGDYGFVCDNSEEGIYEGLSNILKNQKVIKEKKSLLKKYKFDNKTILNKYYEIFK